MEETIARRFETVSAVPQNTRVCERVTLRPAVAFALVTDAEAPDHLSAQLSSGALPDSYHPLIGLLERLTPPGGRVLDLGTHVGTLTLSAAALGYEVVGVEASPRNVALLRASLERNGFDGVRIYHAAVSDRPGTLDFCQAGPYGRVAVPGSWPADVVVPALAVDDLLDEHGWDRVDFIKMDIEGCEVAGLKGLSRRLRRGDAPPIFVESNGHTLSLFGQTPARLRALLEGFGYRVYQVEAGRLIPMRSARFQPSTCVDFLALKGGTQRKAVRRAFRIDPPQSRDELISQVLLMSESTNPVDRVYIARALADAPPSIVSRRTVLDVIQTLRADACESVREAAAAIRLPSALRARCSRLFDIFTT